MTGSLKPDTIRRKKRKPAGACSFGWCSRPPTPGLKTCERCRRINAKYTAKVRGR